ncbi:hypothetical protein Tco_0404225 [Tanacetum coccineum]
MLGPRLGSQTDWSRINQDPTKTERPDQAKDASGTGTQKSYDRSGRGKLMDVRSLETVLCTRVYTLERSILRFGKRGKLTRCYVGPFNVVCIVGKVVYRVNSSRVEQSSPHFPNSSSLWKRPVEFWNGLSKRLKRRRIPLVKVDETLGGA